MILTAQAQCIIASKFAYLSLDTEVCPRCTEYQQSQYRHRPCQVQAGGLHKIALPTACWWTVSPSPLWRVIFIAQWLYDNGRKISGLTLRLGTYVCGSGRGIGKQSAVQCYRHNQSKQCQPKLRSAAAQIYENHCRPRLHKMYVLGDKVTQGRRSENYNSTTDRSRTISS